MRFCGAASHQHCHARQEVRAAALGGELPVQAPRRLGGAWAVAAFGQDCEAAHTWVELEFSSQLTVWLLSVRQSWGCPSVSDRKVIELKRSQSEPGHPSWRSISAFMAQKRVRNLRSEHLYVGALGLLGLGVRAQPPGGSPRGGLLGCTRSHRHRGDLRCASNVGVVN